MISPEKIRQVADALLPGFIPKDDRMTTLSFHFTLVPKDTFKVTYEKDIAGKQPGWTFLTYEKIDII
ncbi:hypothetical protein [Hufsiella ginkgonis]|uniref:Uncharacterized protein n=1 Tax=Hufsiella ginkgonis TaxID=2695274 RepID=A0A7K1XXJ7_9SPHI|nr:hypothetical protein [Hufsiella ginkgonis]MXV15246.1 hypothetical protein [Hufsiella ginkgonis]